MKRGGPRGNRTGARSAAATSAAPAASVESEQQRTRSTEKLFVHKDTLRCAEQHRCRVCCYKIVLYGRSGLLPNVRPELCPRMPKPSKESDEDEKDEPSSSSAPGEADSSSSVSIGLYDAKQVKRILTVGDGNFSYSLALANAFKSVASDVKERVELVATSHESRDTIVETYPDGERILSELAAMSSHVTVHHEIDATNPAQMQALGKFDRVVWNFPCVRAPRGEDGQNKEMETNKQLLADFFAHVGDMLTATGEVHVTHKTKPPFGQWGIESIAENNALRHVRSVIFDRCLYPGYSNKKVLSKGSFPIWDSQTFVFVPASREVEVAAENALGPLLPVTAAVLKLMYLLLSPTIQDRLDANTKHKKKKNGAKQKQIVVKDAVADDKIIAGGSRPSEGKHAGGKQGPASKNLQTQEKRKRAPQPPGRFGHQKVKKMRARK